MNLEEKVNQQGLEFAGGILSLVANIAAPLVNQVERQKKRIMAAELMDIAIREELVMRMTISEIANYAEDLGPLLTETLKSSKCWEKEFMEKLKQGN